MSRPENQAREFQSVLARIDVLVKEGRAMDALALHKEYFPERHPPFNSDFQI